MDGKYNDREFEQFLRENVDNHRLYPSDEVWNKIHAQLHGKKRWPLTTMLVIACTVSSITWLASGDRSTEQPVAITKKQSIQQPAVAAPTTVQRTLAASSTDYFVAEQLPPAAVLELPTLATDAIRSEASASSPANLTESSVQLITTTPSTSALVASASLTTAAPTSASLETASLATTLMQTEQVAPLPLTIESVTNSYQREKHHPKFNWQFHFTPSISYRSLKEDQKLIAQARLSFSTAPSLATPTTDLKNSIRHRPDVGMQLGILGTYPLSKRVDFVAGLQFNVSKYDIKAFNYPTEVATIALVNSWSGPTAVSTLTSFRSNGFMNKASWLRNYYYSLSVPLGLEWRILGKKQNHWGINTSIQPTYVVGNRTYMISMDYQNYAEVPYLINKWNLNVGLETYAKFSIGQHDFRIGPQLRYQLFSSFKKGYPVSEHLYDFGIKLGMQLGK